MYVVVSEIIVLFSGLPHLQLLLFIVGGGGGGGGIPYNTGSLLFPHKSRLLWRGGGGGGGEVFLVSSCYCFVLCVCVCVGEGGVFLKSELALRVALFRTDRW